MIQIWHNPRCSKSRAGVKYLEDKGVEFEIVKYLDNPPSANEIADVLAKLGMSARDLMRTKEAIYRELGLKDEQNEHKLTEAMSAHPKLIERPVVINGDRAVVGRPAEAIDSVV
jgi:arsenate reductase